MVERNAAGYQRSTTKNHSRVSVLFSDKVVHFYNFNFCRFTLNNRSEKPDFYKNVHFLKLAPESEVVGF